MEAGNETLINVLIALAGMALTIAGMVQTVIMAAIAGLLGIVVKLWVAQARQATEIALIKEAQASGATIQEQGVKTMLLQIERRIERKMRNMEARLVALIRHEPPPPPEIPEDDLEPGAGG